MGVTQAEPDLRTLGSAQQSQCAVWPLGSSLIAERRNVRALDGKKREAVVQVVVAKLGVALLVRKGNERTQNLR